MSGHGSLKVGELGSLAETREFMAHGQDAAWHINDVSAGVTFGVSIHWSLMWLLAAQGRSSTSALLIGEMTLMGLHCKKGLRFSRPPPGCH